MQKPRRGLYESTGATPSPAGDEVACVYPCESFMRDPDDPLT
jgi:hypothetical protein